MSLLTSKTLYNAYCLTTLNLLEKNDHLTLQALFDTLTETEIEKLLHTIELNRNKIIHLLSL